MAKKTTPKSSEKWTESDPEAKGRKKKRKFIVDKRRGIWYHADSQ